jgi:DNA polymerase-3 subunit alpha
MSAVMTHNLSNIDKITFFMEECRRMGIQVLGPEVNESLYNFSVNKKGQIRFGLGAVKGVGESAVEALIAERKLNGPFTSIFDVTRRVPAGAFDCFAGTHRAQYFAPDGKDNITGIEKAVRFGNAVAMQAQNQQASLFGEVMVEDVTSPSLAPSEQWSKLEALKKEKEVIGFYISGHPLDDFRFEIQSFCSNSIEDLQTIDRYKNRDVSFAGIITEVNHRMSKTGKPFGNFTLEDFSGAMQLTLFGEDYGKLKQFLEPESLVFIRAKVQNRFHQPDAWEIKPNSIQFLSDIADKMSKQLLVKMRLWDVNKGMISKLGEVFERHKGSVAVRLQIVDVEQNWSVPFTSKNHKVKVNSLLVEELKELTNGEISLT